MKQGREGREDGKVLKSVQRKLHKDSMGKQYEKRITWVIKNFSSLQTEKIYSDYFVVGGCKWRLTAYPKGYKVDNCLSLFLEVAHHGSLPSGWRRHTRYLLTIVNQHSAKNSKRHESQQWFDKKWPSRGRHSRCSLDELHAADGGFLVNGELKIVAEVDVVEVIGKLDVTEDSSTITEAMDVNEFQLLPSQGKSVRLVFKRHPEIASGFLPKNPVLRTGYMSFLLSLIGTMCQAPHELSKDDISSVYGALEFMTEAGFNLDWLEEKVDELSENKEIGETRLQAMEEELKGLKLRCSDMEALVEMEKARVSSAKSPLTFDDVV
ncbi:unnamed protein product [Thlaspi arvense]|uniref:MATH domain-containing protein n=1 Tax=Thlaspi arvense TaxID=13288 RepID=A0AAU9SGR9_THLAR|nr:unnamed protein product [Thlaspi arvense]